MSQRCQGVRSGRSGGGSPKVHCSRNIEVVGVVDNLLKSSMLVLPDEDVAVAGKTVLIHCGFVIQGDVHI